MTIERPTIEIAQNLPPSPPPDKEPRRLWCIVYELPNGEHAMFHGPDTRSNTEAALGYILRQNPEAKFDLSKLREVTRPQINEITMAIVAKYPRRRTLSEITGGKPMLAIYEGWRVPGSRQKPPPSVAKSSWGKLGKW